jgi:hypothetical protein
MSTTTTLMTFKVRTPPTTRSVSLWGSWDNFALPYAMLRDSRIGPEHWTGCHNFSNIICDGHLNAGNQPRQGGLRLGGTYWYYYKLDDDLEFHNSAEPSTTLCPMLPGQLVNVLSVPVVLSGNRSRNASVSSTSSDHRTMNPDDRYVNPRPVPKPTLARLRTSPTLQPDDWPLYTPSAGAHSGRAGRSASSGPGSASTLRFRSKSPGSGLSGSIRHAFRTLKSPRSRSPGDRSAGSVVRSPSFERPERTRLIASAGTSRDTSPVTSRMAAAVPDSDLLLRRPTTGSDRSLECIDMPSFQQHRRQRSRSREPSSLRNSLVLDSGAPLTLVGGQQLGTLKEVASTQNTPAFPVTALKTGDENTTDTVNLEKRLPTLPNTPSSVYPPSTVFRESVDLDALNSHFSATTIDTRDGESYLSSPDSLRFSNWSASYPSTYSSSYYSESVIDEEPMSAARASEVITPTRDPISDNVTEFDDTPQQAIMPQRNVKLTTAVSSSSMSTASNPSMPASPCGSDHGMDSPWPLSDKVQLNAPERFKYQHYRLPEDEFGSEITLKSPAARRDGVMEVPTDMKVSGGLSATQDSDIIAHSSNMQQLMDELAYLGGMIHQK